ncbi:MAG: MFS transporter [Solirubrobacteraceae bacterium]
MPPPPSATARPNAVLAVLVLAALTYSLAQTLIIPAFSSLTDATGTSPATASWLLTGFLVSSCVATPIIGRLGDLYGKRRVLVVVLLIFAAGSVVSAMADGITLMIVGRVVCGIAGGVFPLAFGIARDALDPRRVPGALGAISGVFGIGGAIGLPLSGVIVDHLDLSLIFWTGLLALPAALAVHRIVPPSVTSDDVRVDWAGAALMGTSLVLVLLAITQGNSWGWASATTVGLLAAGLLVGTALFAYEARHPAPLIDVAMLRGRAVGVANLTAMLTGMATFSAFVLIPQFAVAAPSTGYGFGMSVSGAGLLLLPNAVVMVATGPLAGRIGARHGFRVVLGIGTAVIAVSFAWLLALHATMWHFLVASAALGLGIGFVMSALANVVVDAVPRAQVGVATGVNSLARQIGAASGAAVAAAVLAAHTAPASGLPTGTGYTLAFALSAAVSVLAAGAAWLLPRRRPGRRRPDGPPVLARSRERRPVVARI